MVKKSIYTILLVGNMVFFCACGGGGDSTSSTTATTNDNTNEVTILSSAARIDNLTVGVHKNTFDTTSKYYTNFSKLSQAHSDRMDAEMKLLNTLAKPFDVAPAYETYFSKNSNYNATVPAIVINKALTNNYFLVSSSTHFYLEGKTIKTFFKDAAGLSKAWSRAISSADKTKDLYLSLVEVDLNARVTNVTNSLLIKSATLKSF